MTVHLSFPPGDILVFMTGQEDIEATCQVISERIAALDSVSPLLLLPMYSQLPADLQAKVRSQMEQSKNLIYASNGDLKYYPSFYVTQIFDQADGGTRKCIIRYWLVLLLLLLNDVLILFVFNDLFYSPSSQHQHCRDVVDRGRHQVRH